MAVAPELLARGPWDPDDVEIVWREDPFQPEPEHAAEADRMLERLKERGSPAWDGLAARLVSFAQEGNKLKLELQPIRWSLRLLQKGGGGSISALCVVRDADGSWLAGRRAAWVASWAGRWALGAAGSVEVGENPAHTLRRELEEEWSVTPERMQVEALVALSTGMVMLIGQAWLRPGAAVTPDDEHDAFAWWPPEVSDWPLEADDPLRRVGSLLGDADALLGGPFIGED